MPSGYHHDYDDFGEKILRGADLTAHLDGIAQRAGGIAVATAKEDTGEWKSSFVVGTAIEDHDGLRAVGFLLSTDPKALDKEFGYGSTRTMNDAMSQAVNE